MQSIHTDLLENIIWQYLPIEDMISYGNICTRTKRVFLNIKTWRCLLLRDYKIHNITNNPMNIYIWTSIEYNITIDYARIPLDGLIAFQLENIVKSMTEDKDFKQKIIRKVIDSYQGDEWAMSLDDIYLRTKQYYIKYIRDHYTPLFNSIKMMIVAS